MFDLNDAYEEISLDDILNRVSEQELWRYYCRNFEELGKSFLSELYDDSRPSCRIFISPENKMLYKDFGTGDCYSWLQYIKAKYRCTTKEALNIVGNDFNITKRKVDVEPRLILGDNILNKVKKQSKATIEIVPQPWTIQDYEYWNQYKIPLTLLEEYEVFSAKYAYLHKGDKTTIFKYHKDNPIYGYRFTIFGNYNYKIYFPLNTQKGYRFLYDGSSGNIEGFDQLPLSGDYLILTKSLKDCICYRLLGLPAISLQGEANKLSQELVDKLLRRFNKIVINYDNDEQGKISTNKLVKQYGFDYFYIDDAKDLSDFIKINGLDKAKTMIYGKLKREDNTVFS